MRKDISILAMLHRIGQRVRRLKEQEQYFYSIFIRVPRITVGLSKNRDNRRIINLTLPWRNFRSEHLTKRADIQLK